MSSTTEQKDALILSKFVQEAKFEHFTCVKHNKSLLRVIITSLSVLSNMLYNFVALLTLLFSVFKSSIAHKVLRK